jgi:citrate synthase
MPLHRRFASVWRRPEAAQLLRRTLVLLADHELNASTFAARITASTGAPLAGAVLAGLATLAGPLHGNAYLAVAALAADAAREGAGAAARAWLARGQPLPGFGHRLYPAGDPRAEALLTLFPLPPAYAALATIGQELAGEPPNIDFALTALAAAFNLPADAPFTLFAVARSTGWLAHALEQAAMGTPIRPRAAYVGLPPSV